MNSYEAMYQNKYRQVSENYLENLDELFFDHPKQADSSYDQKNDKCIVATNFEEKQLIQDCQSCQTVNSIDVSKNAFNNYEYAKKGSANETMELLPNYKTFISRKIKDLLIIKVLNREQTNNCLAFLRNKPSFQSLNCLLNPVDKCKTLQSALLEFLSSPLIIRQVLQSRIRVQQKRKLLKFINRMTEEVKNPGKYRRWKLKNK